MLYEPRIQLSSPAANHPGILGGRFDSRRIRGLRLPVEHCIKNRWKGSTTEVRQANVHDGSEMRPCLPRIWKARSLKDWQRWFEW